MDKFEQETINCQNIKAIRSYNFKYHEYDVVLFACQLLDNSLISIDNWHPDPVNFFRNYHRFKPTIGGIKRFFTNGCLWPWDEFDCLSYMDFKRYLPSPHKLDEIAKSIMDFDKENHNRVMKVISEFNKVGVELFSEVLKGEIDFFTVRFQLDPTDRLRLNLNLRLVLESNINDGSLNIALIDGDYHEDRDSYDMKWKKKVTSYLDKFEFVNENKITLNDSTLIKRLIDDLIHFVSEASTYKNCFDRLKGYKYFDSMTKCEFKVKYDRKRYDHYEVQRLRT